MTMCCPKQIFRQRHTRCGTSYCHTNTLSVQSTFPQLLELGTVQQLLEQCGLTVYSNITFYGIVSFAGQDGLDWVSPAPRKVQHAHSWKQPVAGACQCAISAALPLETAFTAKNKHNQQRWQLIKED